MTLKMTVSLCTLLGAASFLLSGWAAAAEESGASPEAAETTAGSAPSAPIHQEDASALLKSMAKLLSQAQGFSVHMRCNYDVIQGSGEKIEFHEVRDVILRRPDRLRVEVEQSDGDKNLVLFDGKDLTVYSMPQNVYATAAKPGSTDEAIIYFVRDLQMRLPLALLLVSALPAELDRRVQAIDYVERTTLLGAPSHHLAGRTETVDFQVWVAEGDRPLLQRVVLTYKNLEGQPQFRAQFSDWHLSPQVTDATFAFTPPSKAKKIVFLPQLRQVAVPNPGTAKERGEQE